MQQIIPKIRTRITTADFKKYAPRVLGQVVSKPVVRQPVKIPKIVQQTARRNIFTPRSIPLNQPTPSIYRPPKPVTIRSIPSVAISKQIKARNVEDFRRDALARARIKTKVSTPQRQVVNSRAELLRGMGKNKILVIIAAGPSIAEVDFTPLKTIPNIDIMCVNKPHPQVWPTKIWSFCDDTQRQRNLSTWNSYTGIIINSYNVKERKANQHVIASRSGKGFSTDIVHGYHIGRSSTYASLQVAVHMGYSRIYVFGVDMAEVNGKLHFYGQNPDVSNETRKKRFANEADHYLWAGQNLQQSIKDRFVFCSSYNPWPFMNLFSKLDHKIAVSEVLKNASNLNL